MQPMLTFCCTRTACRQPHRTTVSSGMSILRVQPLEALALQLPQWCPDPTVPPDWPALPAWALAWTLPTRWSARGHAQVIAAGGAGQGRQGQAHGSRALDAFVLVAMHIFTDERPDCPDGHLKQTTARRCPSVCTCMYGRVLLTKCGE